MEKESCFMSFDTMAGQHGVFKENLMLENRLIFGYHRDIVGKTGTVKQPASDAADRARKLLNSWIDGVEHDIFPGLYPQKSILKRVTLRKLLTAVALQIGQEIKYSTIAGEIGVNDKTVYRYIQLLSEAGVVFILPAFSNGKEMEMATGKKIYFYDCGVRNALINNFNSFKVRNDRDVLWENFVIAERYKYRGNRRVKAEHFFWRTFNHQKIDLIERKDQVYAYKIIWTRKPNPRFDLPGQFLQHYPGVVCKILYPAIIETFIARKKLRSYGF